MRFKRLVLLLMASIVASCSSSGSSSVKVGIDPNWYPLNFGPQTSYVNGFIEDLLLQVSKNSGIKFEKIQTNWDTLYEGLQKDQYDAVLGSLPAYDFYAAQYSFSKNALDLGPILIVPSDAQISSLQEMENKRVGVINGSATIAVLQKDPKIMIRDTYPSIPDLLMAVAGEEIEGAVLEQIPAANYLQDLFKGKLKAATPPLNNSGLRLIVLKGDQDWLIAKWNQSIDQLKAKGVLRQLLKKWQLGE